MIVPQQLLGLTKIIIYHQQHQQQHRFNPANMSTMTMTLTVPVAALTNTTNTIINQNHPFIQNPALRNHTITAMDQIAATPFTKTTDIRGEEEVQHAEAPTKSSGI